MSTNRSPSWMLFHIFDWIFITGPFLVWQFPFPGCVIRMLGMGLSHLVTGWVHPEEYILCVIIWNLLWSVGKCPRFGTVSLRLQKAKVPFPPVYNSPEQVAHSAGPASFTSLYSFLDSESRGERMGPWCVSQLHDVYCMDTQHNIWHMVDMHYLLTG